MADWFKKPPIVFDLGKEKVSTPEKDSVVAKICACDNCRETAMCKPVDGEFLCLRCIEAENDSSKGVGFELHVESVWPDKPVQIITSPKTDFDLLGGPCQ